MNSKTRNQVLDIWRTTTGATPEAIAKVVGYPVASVKKVLFPNGEHKVKDKATKVVKVIRTKVAHPDKVRGTSGKQVDRKQSEASKKAWVLIRERRASGYYDGKPTKRGNERKETKQKKPAKIVAMNTDVVIDEAIEKLEDALKTLKNARRGTRKQDKLRGDTL